MDVRLALWVLMVVSLFNYLDRQVVNILAEPIKHDLNLSDTQLGLLTGIAFALFYTLLGVPLARFADSPRSNRISLIAACLAVWSGMTFLCGLANSFAQLLLARVGVGIGEAGCTPAAHSLITDLTPRERHASALALFGIGAPVGGLLGMALGGVIADHYGWRSAFMILGAPGLLFAIFVWVRLREPRLFTVQARQGEGVLALSPPMSAGAAFGEVIRSKAFAHLAAAASFVAFLSYGKSVWQAVLFIRIHHLSPGQTGIWLGLTAGVGGMLGMYIGGRIADRMSSRRAGLVLAGPALGLGLGAPLLLAAYMHSDWRMALVLLFLPIVGASLWYGPTFSCVQRLVKPGARATAAAIMLFIVNVIGLGLGPLFFGMMSDFLTPWTGAQSLRWVLGGAALIGVVPAVFYWRAGRHLERELAD